MPLKQNIWRVRVYRKVEDWVSLKADTPLQAEEIASTMPGVISVFGQSALRGDKPVDQVPPVGVLEDDE